MIIPRKVEAVLNQHLEMEANAVFNYLAVASWCEREGLEGCSKFYRDQSAEEHIHFMKFFDYINDVGEHAIVPAVQQPKSKFKNIKEVCEYSLKGEQAVTKSIYNIITIAEEEGDKATIDFLRFFVDEQREEEVQFKRIIDRIKLIGDGPQSLYYIDKEFEEILNQKVKNADKKKA